VPGFLFQPKKVIQKSADLRNDAPNKPAPAGHDDEGNDGQKRRHLPRMRLNGKLLTNHPNEQEIRPQRIMMNNMVQFKTFSVYLQCRLITGVCKRKLRNSAEQGVGGPVSFPACG
jgi:hypothetical protein